VTGQHVKSPAPVGSALHFTGRADMIASVLVQRQIAWNTATSYAHCMDALNRNASLTHTLKEQP
jgi:hypothetical protein